MSAHAKYAPSASARNEVCPASARMEAQFPDEETQDSRDGVAVHWAGAELLHGRPVALGQVADNGVVLTTEMVEGAELYANHIMQRGPVGHVEETLTEPALHPDNWGTPDHWVFDWQFMTLYMDDLKFGHRFVDVRWNTQLIEYAALALKTLKIDDDHPFFDDVNIVFTLALPRCYHSPSPVQVWRTTWGEIDHRVDQLQASMYAADQPDAPCNATDVQACRDCKARFACDANLQAGAIAVGVTGQAIPLHLAPLAKVKMLRVLRDAELRIKSLREGIEQDVVQTIRRKQAVPFFALEGRPGREVFNGDNTIVEVAKLYGVDVMKAPSFITPKQAIDAGVPADVVRLFSKKNSGALELVEYDGSDVSDIFKSKE